MANANSPTDDSSPTLQRQRRGIFVVMSPINPSSVRSDIVGQLEFKL
jgi:hypothetical protein